MFQKLKSVTIKSTRAMSNSLPVLLTSSMVQDGHAMLPLFSYSMKDALVIKIFNAVFAIAIGLLLLLLGW